MGRIVVVVDEDVDPSNLADVMWAVTTRCEPSESVDIIRNAWSSALDPRIPMGEREAGVTSHSKMIIDACKPFGWMKDYSPTSALLPDEAAAVAEKWDWALSGRRS
jgi:3-polyprenyl-4-hydroxybenzoate decarboxylase